MVTGHILWALKVVKFNIVELPLSILHMSLISQISHQDPEGMYDSGMYYP